MQKQQVFSSQTFLKKCSSLATLLDKKFSDYSSCIKTYTLLNIITEINPKIIVRKTKSVCPSQVGISLMSVAPMSSLQKIIRIEGIYAHTKQPKRLYIRTTTAQISNMALLFITRHYFSQKFLFLHKFISGSILQPHVTL